MHSLAEIASVVTPEATSFGSPAASTTSMRTLKIQGMEQVTLMLLPALHMMGFSAVHIQDSRLLQAQQGLPAQWVGRPRQALACSMMRQWCPQVSLGVLYAPSMTLLTGSLAVDPLEEQLLMDKRQPFIPILAMDDGIDIGPCVWGPHQPCATCVMLHYQDRDPMWIRALIERQQGEAAAPSNRAVLEAVSLLIKALTTFDSDQPELAGGHVFHVLNQGIAFDEEVVIHPRCPWHQPKA